MEKFGKKLGVPKEELQKRKHEFEANIKQMDVKEAVKLCSTQNSILEMAK